MSQLSANVAGNKLFPPPAHGVTSVAATVFAAGTGGVRCALKMNPTSTAGESQVLGSIITVTPNANGDDLILPPVAQCDGMVLYIVNLHASDTIDLQYVDAAGSDAAMFLGAVVLDNDEIATCVCDGTYWYAAVGTAT
jgi:hypothetical protein